MIGVVKGVEPGRHGLIFVSIMLLPLLASAFTQLKWTNGEAIDERLGKLANFNAVVVVGIDIALMVRQRGTRAPAAAVAFTAVMASLHEQGGSVTSFFLSPL